MEAVTALSEIFGVSILSFEYDRSLPDGRYVPPDRFSFEFVCQPNKWLTVDLDGLHLQSVGIGPNKGHAVYDLYSGRVSEQIRKVLGISNVCSTK